MLPSGASSSSRAVIAAFFSVALVSSGLLGVLGWKLLQQDRELQKTRLEERRAQAGEGLLAWMRDSPTANGTPSPASAVGVTIDGSQVLLTRGTLVYYPHDRPQAIGEPAQVFEEGERLEYLTPGLAWTPDGQAILYRDDKYRVMRMPATGGTPQFTGLTVFGFYGFTVRPTTGSQIAFGQETRPELWKMEKLTSVLNEPR